MNNEVLKWELASDGDGIVCPKCKEDFCTVVFETERFHYCPNCGVKLEPAQQETESHKDILKFIKHFQNEDTIRAFSTDMCYWFTVILARRFVHYDSFVVYNPIECHFAICIDGRIYDITGDITDKYSTEFVDWFSYPDKLHKARIIRDVIMKVDEEGNVI